ncbi:hypothetical protein [Thioalkalivibrio sp. ALJ16]|uniref:hypothetical protein n=1 Tax=Thioalkalivibrio sp. ALJ16 TaxID=1158762 RepID=UPI0003812B94|nr:hypothetical protein [Thioalkalivibrio sp. ALJ16]
MAVLFIILALAGLTLMALRLYTHLAVHQRRVVASWHRLDTLLAQRNGELDQVPRLPGLPASSLDDLHQAIQHQETARRKGDLPTLAVNEQRIRDGWDGLVSQHTDLIQKWSQKPVVGRVQGLDLAINDALAAYNTAVDAAAALRRRPVFALLAGIAGYSRFRPIEPPTRR